MGPHVDGGGRVLKLIGSQFLSMVTFSRRPITPPFFRFGGMAMQNR